MVAPLGGDWGKWRRDWGEMTRGILQALQRKMAHTRLKSAVINARKIKTYYQEYTKLVSKSFFSRKKILCKKTQENNSKILYFYINIYFVIFINWHTISSQEIDYLGFSWPLTTLMTNEPKLRINKISIKFLIYIMFSIYFTFSIPHKNQIICSRRLK